jgi:hypothetical protein
MMDYMWFIFIAVLLISFAIVLLATGAFTAYFGSGRSRMIGAGLMGSGVVIGLLVLVMFWYNILFPKELMLIDEVIIPGIIFIVSAGLGALAAIGLFILAIMKA